MKLLCSCGYVMSDTTDGLFFKAHFIPDQDWFGLLDAIDDAIEHGGGTDAACMRIRYLIGDITSPVYQCPECGRLFIDDRTMQTHIFAPDSDAVPRKLFGSRRKIKLVVKDPRKSVAFYRDGLGVTLYPHANLTDGADHVEFELPSGFTLMLIRRGWLYQFSKMAELFDQKRDPSECVETFYLASKEEVDALLNRAKAVGGKEVAAKSERMGYVRHIKDPDGHLWEIICYPDLAAQT